MLRHFLHDLRTTFQRQARRPALVHRNRTWTYAELDSTARACAAYLQSIGVAAGDRVALYTDQKLPLLVANLGVWLAGGVPLPLNPRFTREEMRYYLSDSGAIAVIAGRDQQPLVEQLARELPQPPLVVPDSAVLAPPPATFREVTSEATDPSLILYSSGTTGWPKGVVHTQANVASSLAALAACWRVTPDDVVVNVLPLFHIHGLAFATHLTWLAGGCVRILDAFEPRETLAAIGQGTIFMAVPPIYYRLLDTPEFRGAASGWDRVRLFTCGSAPIRTEVLPELQQILGPPIINRYGMSEAFVISSLPLDGPWPDGSVGLPLSGVELRVQHAENRAAAAREAGAVQLRGPNLFREYWNKPEATAAAFSGGWFDTGDLGQLDSAGMLTLVGRQHDLIITSGYNVYPQVVERVIGECPGVLECAVLGLPDKDRGERVAAAVVRGDASLDESRLRNWWRDRLVHYQQPKSILFVESLPKNSLGKILRRELRERFGE
ncbi:MAG TPA: class I adenylate-forming enzyme family protein [Pirellulaceae bacterium]|nr:class I adenylate-forming enzyme family protein [Pirellulaceae bacterium]